MNSAEKEVIYNDVLETIKECTKTTKSLIYPIFCRNSAMYTFSTENLSGYINKLKLANKKVLTITASGDQMLNLIFNGTKNIDNFDINKNAYYFSELKIAALKTLLYDEFLTYFVSCEQLELTTGFISFQKQINDNPYVFDYNCYKKFRENLDGDSLMYWDMLYEKFNYDGKKLYSTVCIGSDKQTAIFSNDYLKNKNNYEQIKLKISDININYYEGNFLELHKLNKKYDAILLSNIYDYMVSDYYNIISDEEFSNYVNNNLCQILNDDGIIALSYQYHYKTKNYIGVNCLKDLFKRKYVLQRKPMLDKLSDRKILVPCIIKEYRKEKEKDCLYLYNGKSK